MIQLKPDCLIFQTADGEQIPCSAETVTLELMGEAAKQIDPEIIRDAAAAVLHYFKHELKRDFVPVAEFVVALDKALRGIGLTVFADEPPEPPVAESDLRVLAANAGKGCELFFFPCLREEVKSKLGEGPRILRFNGLRGCVKQLTGAQRWSDRCDRLSDQIVEFLRSAWQSESASQSCTLLVL
jgi:hypothetical protein